VVKRQRLHVNVNGTILRFCPDCAKKMRHLLFDFSA
jgi:ribosome-binding protein aMBF1 (putative translation factor)